MSGAFPLFSVFLLSVDFYRGITRRPFLHRSVFVHSPSPAACSGRLERETMCHLTPLLAQSPNAFAGAVNLLRYLFFICSVTRSPRFFFFQSTVVFVVRLIPIWTGRFLCSSAPPLATVSGAAIPELMTGRDGKKGMDGRMGGSFQIKMDCFPLHPRTLLPSPFSTVDMS